VVVGHSRGLHEGIANGGTDKPEASVFQVFAHGLRRFGPGRDIGEPFPSVSDRFVIDELPDVKVETAEFLLNVEKGPCIGDHRGDFKPVANDAPVLQKLVDFFFAVPRYAEWIESIQGVAEVFAFFQDGHPTQTGLGTFENQQLKLPATSCGESPLLRKFLFFIRSLTPLQATGLALAVQFKETPVIVKGSAQLIIVIGDHQGIMPSPLTSALRFRVNGCPLLFPAVPFSKSRNTILIFQCPV